MTTIDVSTVVLVVMMMIPRILRMTRMKIGNIAMNAERVTQDAEIREEETRDAESVKDAEKRVKEVWRVKVTWRVKDAKNAQSSACVCRDAIQPETVVGNTCATRRESAARYEFKIKSAPLRSA